MKYKIGVFGSAEGESNETQQKAMTIGRLLGREACVVITGACSGLPYLAANEAYKNGAHIWGYSPVVSLEEQRRFTPNDNLDIYSKLEYVPKDFAFANDPLVCKKYRNIISTANCDAGIIIAGRWGTLNEFTNLIDMGKTIAILTNTSGIANELFALRGKIHKETTSKVLFYDDPQKLIEELFSFVGCG